MPLVAEREMVRCETQVCAKCKKFSSYFVRYREIMPNGTPTNYTELRCAACHEAKGGR